MRWLAPRGSPGGLTKPKSPAMSSGTCGLGVRRRPTCRARAPPTATGVRLARGVQRRSPRRWPPTRGRWPRRGAARDRGSRPGAPRSRRAPRPAGMSFGAGTPSRAFLSIASRRISRISCCVIGVLVVALLARLVGEEHDVDHLGEELLAALGRLVAHAVELIHVLERGLEVAQRDGAVADAGEHLRGLLGGEDAGRRRARVDRGRRRGALAARARDGERAPAPRRVARVASIRARATHGPRLLRDGRRRHRMVGTSRRCPTTPSSLREASVAPRWWPPGPRWAVSTGALAAAFVGAVEAYLVFTHSDRTLASLRMVHRRRRACSRRSSSWPSCARRSRAWRASFARRAPGPRSLRGMVAPAQDSSRRSSRASSRRSSGTAAVLARRGRPRGRRSTSLVGRLAAHARRAARSAARDRRRGRRARVRDVGRPRAMRAAASRQRAHRQPRGGPLPDARPGQGAPRAGRCRRARWKSLRRDRAARTTRSSSSTSTWLRVWFDLDAEAADYRHAWPALPRGTAADGDAARPRARRREARREARAARLLHCAPGAPRVIVPRHAPRRRARRRHPRPAPTRSRRSSTGASSSSSAARPSAARRRLRHRRRTSSAPRRASWPRCTRSACRSASSSAAATSSAASRAPARGWTAPRATTWGCWRRSSTRSPCRTRSRRPACRRA